MTLGVRPAPGRAAAPVRRDRIAGAIAGLVATGLVLEFSVSANLLTLVGIPYEQPGGDPLLKFHPATWLIGLAGLLAWPRAARDAAGRTRALAAAAGLMVAAMLLSVASVGPSGAAVYIESFLAPIGLAFAMRTLGPRAGRSIGRVALAMVLANVVVALSEVVAQAHLVPIYLEDRILIDPPGEFRPAALFDHPLTAAMATMTALICLPTLGLPRGLRRCAACLLALGLLAYGGRAALVVTALALSGAGAVRLWQAGLQRRLDIRSVAALALAACVLLAGLAGILAETSLGGRIAAHLYLDQSAQSRSVEWRLLDELDLRTWLFGMPIDREPELIYRLGLQYPFTDIENFWLMAFVDLGLVGFALYAAAIATFLAALWRGARHPALRLAIPCLVLVASTSNSLGRKCCVLTVLAAFAEAGAAAPATGRRTVPLAPPCPTPTPPRARAMMPALRIAT